MMFLEEKMGSEQKYSHRRSHAALMVRDREGKPLSGKNIPAACEGRYEPAELEGYRGRYEACWKGNTCEFDLKKDADMPESLILTFNA